MCVEWTICGRGKCCDSCTIVYVSTHVFAMDVDWEWDPPKDVCDRFSRLDGCLGGRLRQCGRRRRCRSDMDVDVRYFGEI